MAEAIPLAPIYSNPIPTPSPATTTSSYSSSSPSQVDVPVHLLGPIDVRDGSMSATASVRGGCSPKKKLLTTATVIIFSLAALVVVAMMVFVYPRRFDHWIGLTFVDSEAPRGARVLGAVYQSDLPPNARVIHPGDMMTADLCSSRLNLYLNEVGVIIKLSWG
eukprot:TRINITY_DN5730_c0_g1_i1.p1 TRINITY_DN5730_c0_g1~~TRINITY_DN5730_c0_g1_i1.p1  ORF type:complete len:163 (-),score=42.33 TRINITY_DN5730_c0_g1_i1:184-672(-)